VTWADVDIEAEIIRVRGKNQTAGEVLYRTEGSSAAQRALHHEGPSTTSKMYSHIEASEQTEVASNAFEKIDKRTTTETNNS